MKSLSKVKHILSVLAVGVFLILAFGSSDTDNTTNDTETTSTTEVKEQSPEEFKEQLKKELASFDKPFDNSAYNGSVDAITIELVLFGAWAQIIEKGEASEDLEIKKLTADLKKKVINLQVKEFPIMRKRYGEIVAEKMWVNDIYVKTLGTGSSILDFTGGTFAANRNIQDVQTTLTEIIRQLRFKETRYRWYKEASEYTYYKMEPPKDSELVTFKK